MARVKSVEDPKMLSEVEWQKRLTPEQFETCRQRGTESPFSGKYVDHKEDGTFTCVACNTPLFSSATKYDSGSGWPSFWAAIETPRGSGGDEVDGGGGGGVNVDRQPDDSIGRRRIEITCKTCASHLGHVFDDGPEPTGERFCVNSESLHFQPAVAPGNKVD